MVPPCLSLSVAEIQQLGDQMVCDKICFFPPGTTLDRNLAASKGAIAPKPKRVEHQSSVPGAGFNSTFSSSLSNCDPKGTLPSVCVGARPPQQTAAGQGVIDGPTWGGLDNIAKQSKQQREWALALMDGSVRRHLNSTSMSFFANMSASDMLNLLEWEFFYLPMLHNGPLEGNKGGDDSDLFTNFANGYIQSTQQRWTLGAEDGSN